MNRAFIDTSVLLRFLVKDDDLKSKAVEKLLLTASGRGTVLHILSRGFEYSPFVGFENSPPVDHSFGSCR